MQENIRSNLRVESTLEIGITNPKLVKFYLLLTHFYAILVIGPYVVGFTGDP